MLLKNMPIRSYPRGRAQERVLMLTDRIGVRDWRTIDISDQTLIGTNLGYPNEDKRLEIWNNHCDRIRAHYRHCKGINDLRLKYKGKTALVCLSGASVLKILPIIQEAKQKGYVIISGGAFPALVDDGVVDYVLHMDYTEPSYLPWYPQQRNFSQSTLIAPFYVHPDILERFENIRFFCDPQNLKGIKFHAPGQYGWLDGQLHAGHNMVHFADFLGCDRILLAGMDLAFLHGKEHFYQDFDEAKVKEKYKDLVTLRAGDEEIKSCSLFLQMAELMEGVAVLLRRYKVEMINFTGEGVLGRMFDDSAIGVTQWQAPAQ